MSALGRVIGGVMLGRSEVGGSVVWPKATYTTVLNPKLMGVAMSTDMAAGPPYGNPTMKYTLPTFLKGIISQQAYSSWLRRRTIAHVKHDRARGFSGVVPAEYRQKFHEAVIESGGVDSYTGETLDFTLVGQFNNVEAKSKGVAYLRRFALLPSIDHFDPGVHPASFKICSRRTNDAKSSMTEGEFVDLCRRVVAHAGRKRMRRTAKPNRTPRRRRTR